MPIVSEGQGLKVGELDRIVRDLAENGELFRVGWDGLLRHLLAKYDKQIFHAMPGPEQLRVFAGRALGESPDKLPNDTLQLARYVGLQFFGTLPRDKFIEVQQQAADDLREIRTNISKCTKELDEINARKSKGTEKEGDSHRGAYLEYKVEQNGDAREEILQFLEGGVADEVVFSTRTWPRVVPFEPLHFIHYPYHYRHAPHVYSPESLSEIRNKFGNEPLSVMDELERLYESDLDQFHLKVQNYIDANKVVDVIREQISSHHRLAARSEVLAQSLDVYHDGKYALFCNVIPIQIEGLVDDWARELGIHEKDLRKAPLTQKLDQINQVTLLFGDFEYFRFSFPVLRNRVAHGRVESANVNQANLLLLDLADLCRRLHDKILPANWAVAFLKDLHMEAPDYKALFDYIQLRDLLRDQTLSNFYSGLAEKRVLADEILSSTGFWSWLGEQVDSPFVSRGAIREAAVALKKANLDCGQAQMLLKRIPAHGTEDD